MQSKAKTASLIGMVDRFETLEVVREGPVLHVRLDRPDVLNAFNGTVVAELRRAFDDASAGDARVVVLSGKGKSFCAGVDLGWMRDQGELPRDENEKTAVEMASMFLSIARCRKPVVARIQRHALGGGTGLAAAVDIAICTEDCLFGLTEVKLGFVPGVISPFVLQKIDAGRARTLFLTGERFDGVEAERVGLVHRAVPESELDRTVQATVDQLLTSGPLAVGEAKELIAKVAGLSLEDAIVTSVYTESRCPLRVRLTP